jgi:hypothetical protein
MGEAGKREVEHAGGTEASGGGRRGSAPVAGHSTVSTATSGSPNASATPG